MPNKTAIGGLYSLMVWCASFKDQYIGGEDEGGSLNLEFELPLPLGFKATVRLMSKSSLRDTLKSGYVQNVI